MLGAVRRVRQAGWVQCLLSSLCCAPTTLRPARLAGVVLEGPPGTLLLQSVSFLTASVVCMDATRMGHAPVCPAFLVLVARAAWWWWTLPCAPGASP
jgi:hypothetical protein